MKDDGQGMGVSPSGPGSREPSQQAVSAADAASIPDAGHTPGPWVAGDVRYQRDLRVWLNVTAPNPTGDLGELFVAAVSSDPQHTDTTAANARLIAAAPELHEALWSIVDAWNDIDRAFPPHDMPERISHAHKALNKATAQWDGSGEAGETAQQAPSRSDDSPVGSEADDAPNLHPTPSSHPSGDRNTVLRDTLEWIGGHDAGANGLTGFAFELVEQLTGAARDALKSDTPEPSGDAVEQAWLRVRENLNRLHLEGVITYGELKHGVNSAALIRDAAIAAIRPTLGVSELADGDKE